MKKSKISMFLGGILKIMLVCGIICIFFLPKLYNLFADSGVPSFTNQSISYQIAFYACYIISLCIIFELTRIFSEVYKDTPFKKTIEISLKKIAVMFMLLSVIVAIKIIFIPTILSAAVTLITFIASLSFYVLSQVFKAAIEYKDEIDYTV